MKLIAVKKNRCDDVSTSQTFKRPNQRQDKQGEASHHPIASDPRDHHGDFTSSSAWLPINLLFLPKLRQSPLPATTPTPPPPATTAPTNLALALPWRRRSLRLRGSPCSPPPPPRHPIWTPAPLDANADSYVLLVPVRLRRLRRGAAAAASARSSPRSRCSPRRVPPLARRPGRQRGAPPPRARLRLRAPHRPRHHLRRAQGPRPEPGPLRARLRPPRRRHRLPRRAARARHLRRRARRARAVSYIDANLSLDGISVVEDAIYLLEDLARGSVPFDTVAEVEGHVHLFFLSIPVKVSADETFLVDCFCCGLQIS